MIKETINMYLSIIKKKSLEKLNSYLKCLFYQADYLFELK